MIGYHSVSVMADAMAKKGITLITKRLLSSKTFGDETN
jgi:hypothetical protein